MSRKADTQKPEQARSDRAPSDGAPSAPPAPSDKAKPEQAKSDTPKSDRSIFASRIGFAFAVVAAMTVILSGAITYVAWTVQFDRYVKRNLQDTADNIAAHASEAYAVFGNWSFSQIPFIPQVGTRAEVAVQIFDQFDNLVYDESMVNAYQQNGIEQLPKDARPIPLDPTNRHVITSPILVDKHRVGEVRVYAYGSYGLLTRHDLEMRDSSLFALGVAGFVAIIAATIIGAIYARHLVRPILRMTEMAQRLRDGDEGARCELTGDDEIAQLGMTFDHMAEAIQSDRHRERRLTGDVAHELRTPLMGIQATVEAIEDGIYPADSEHLSLIGRETRRLSGLTSTILELSRLENASERFETTRLDLNIPVSASIAVNAALIESLGLSLESSQEPDLFVEGNSERLQQAIGNLLGNAARYTPEGGKILVRTFSEDGCACVSVTDTGIGISAEDMEQIFSRFWRADSARSRASGGVGVGLTITKEIIDRHRGGIRVESKPQHGTTFTIKLPLL